MKLVSMPYDFDQAKVFIEKEIDCLLLGQKDLSLRCAKYFSWNQIKKISEIKNKTKIFVLVNQFFFENDLKLLQDGLIKLASLKIDGVYFQDYAVAQIVKEQKLNIQLIYHSETLVTSYGQFDFFLKNNINHVVIARELFLSELKQIALNKPKKLKIEIQVHGFMFVMHSRWKMITNFENYTGLTKIKNQKQLWIREALRKIPNAIYEDKYGTHMFTGYELCLIKYLNQLRDLKIDYLRIDNAMQNKLWCDKITNIYSEAIKLSKENKLTDKKIKLINNEIEKIVQPNLFSPGFLGTIQDNYHLIKSNNETDIDND